MTRPSGALPAPEKPLTPEDSAIWGAARTLANERPDCTVRRISWERTHDLGTDAHRLALELLVPTAEDEVALTAAGRFVPRQIEQLHPQRLVAPHHGNYRVDLRQQGLLYHLTWVDDTPRPPNANQVAIEVHAAALNYRDVMVATGMLPPDAEDPSGPQILGLECAGVVTDVGENVTAVQPGDRVCGFAPGSFASHTVTEADRIVKIPPTMGFNEAATLPVAFLTVHHSLDHQARLAAGETIVVHGAAGGVGLAAIQHARLVGARVIATAGTPAKRDLLTMLGVHYVFDSRTLTFADQIMAVTDGEGVDVVLNSLSGEAIPRGIDLLRPGGRFIELGKRDIYANSRIMLRGFRNNITFSCVDISKLSDTDALLARAELETITDRVHTGTYRPLLHRTYPASRITEAFRLMQHSQHVGKIVVTFDDLVLVEHRPTPLNLDPEGTYLITGGLGGVGGAVACALARCGARHLALVGRRGMASPEAPSIIETLDAEGAQAAVYAADVTDPAAMAAVTTAIDASGHALRGVIHGAMQLDDTVIDELDETRFENALTAKMRGVLILDNLTRHLDLDFFVAFSSMTAVVGTFKQASYVAGNLFLEALIRSRRTRGLPGLAIAWGAIAEVGYVARHGLIEQLGALGLRSLTPNQVMESLSELLGLTDNVVCVGDVEWGPASTVWPLMKSPRLAGLLPPLVEGTDYRRDEFASLLATRSPDDAHQLIQDTLVQIVGEILQTPRERVDRNRQLDQMGLDSLMAIELVTASSEQFQCEIPLMEIATNGTSINALAKLILERLTVCNETVTTGDDGEVLGQEVVDRYLGRQRGQ